MSQKWFSISIIVLIIVICTFMSSVKQTFGVGCLRRTGKEKGPAVFDDDDYIDFKELRTMVEKYNKLYKDKLGKTKSKINLTLLGVEESKRKHIQCTNCVILRYYLKQLKWIVEKLIRGNQTDSQQFSRDLNSMKNHVTQMLSLLYALNSSDIQHWLYTFFFKISAVQSWNETKQMVIDNFESYTALDTVLSKFITLCLDKSYLPVDAPFNYNMSFTKSNSYTIRETVFRPLYDNCVFYKKSKYHSWFTEDNMYLTGLWGKEHGLLVGNVPGICIDWQPVQARLAERRAMIEEFYTEKLWVHDPYRCVGYHSLIVELIDVRLYSYVCVHLQVYINGYQAGAGLNNYWRYNIEFHFQLTTAFESLQIGDVAAQKTLDKLCGITNRYSRHYADNLLTDVALKIHTILGIVPPTSGSIVDNILSIKAKDSSVELLKENIDGLIDFTKTFNNEIQPVDWSFVLLFIEASAQDDDKFFVE
ncbi:uncharacterized protein LOC126843185 [Adelges cooleyi]|uniref:uncharacterized protein LOC126843185 n=1 Tax=Adelges cooleyi TaxID=133065 RepID=UPI00217FA0E9|nr:uncharacterized protein LOC126843185 [Adelges cooleyi]